MKIVPIIEVVGALVIVFFCALCGFSKGQGDITTAEYIVTSYCGCTKCTIYGDMITASGHRIRPSDTFVAAPSDIAFYTLVTVKGYNDGNPVPVLDRGGDIREGHIDVYFSSHEKALIWGRQVLQVTIHE